MAEISTARYRAGEGEPLVLIHGFTAVWRCWLPVLAELVPRFEVIAPTLHGHDGGPRIEPGREGHRIADAADHLESQLDELGVGTAHLAGNSLGGALALELAKRGRARSVVAISPAGGWPHGDQREVERIIRLFARSRKLTLATLPRLPQVMRHPQARRLALRDVIARGHQVPAGEAVAMARSAVRCSVIDAVFAALRAGNGELHGLESVGCPTLVLWGERDRVLPPAKHAPRFRAELPHAEFRTLPGLGHVPMWDDPHLIASSIATFASAVPATA